MTRLHLLAHGAPGEIRFGGQAVTAADFRQRFDGAAQRDLSIAFWSCRTGAGAAGQAFVQAVSAATGARVAATSELVGAADKGGNWDLGVTAPFSAEARAGFGEVLIVSAPTLVTVACNPPDDGVLSTNQIVLVFSEPVVVNTVFQIVIFSLTNPVRVFQSDGPTSMFGIPSGSGIITGNTLTLTLGQSLAPGESYYVNTLNPGPQGTGLMSVSTSQLFQDIVGPTTYNFTVGVPTFTALESGGTLSFGGDATGDIALTVAADGALTAVRGGVTATEHPNIKDITSVTTGGATITLTGAAALGETNFPQGTDLAIANAGQVFRTVDIGGTDYYFPAT
ncbi:MAG: DUF4347 domain-containing protein, partial [Actinobacteria bacterium]|nr:DUF4347 domain-containing protein [Actinomycetota bacterium]